jgi:hypothetical protein
LAKKQERKAKRREKKARKREEREKEKERREKRHERKEKSKSLTSTDIMKGDDFMADFDDSSDSDSGSDSGPRNAITGRRLKKKLERSKEDKAAEAARKHMLMHLNAIND